MNIRELISNYRNEVGKGNLAPQRAAEILTELSSIMGTILDEIQGCEMKYNKFLLKCYDSEQKANRAKIVAEISPEYEAMRTAKNTLKVVEEMIRALKYLLRALEEGYRQAGN